MSETTYAKCACELCGGRIEFPAEAEGRSITCPHCGGTTVLSAEVAAPPPRKSRALKWIVLSMVCFVCAAVALVAIKILFFGKMPRGVSAKVISFERAAPSNPGVVVGVVENHAGRARRGVRVEIELLNLHGEPLWSTTASSVSG